MSTSNKMRLTRRGLLTGAAALAVHKALAEGIDSPGSIGGDQFGRMSAMSGVQGAIYPNFMNDGASLPWTPPNSPSQIYVPSTTTTWFAWQGYQSIAGTLTRVVEVAGYNHTTQTWSGNYIAAYLGVQDFHGSPSIAVDSAGYLYVFFGAWASALFYASTINPNDPTSWQGGTLAGTFIWPQPVFMGLTLYLFSAGPGLGTGTEEALQLNIATCTNGVPSFGATAKLIDLATAGNNAWIPLGDFVPSGTDIHFTFTWAANIGSSSRGVYYGIFDTLTLNVSNYTKGVTVVPGSQPIAKTTADASFLIIDQVSAGKYGGLPSLNIVSGTSHVEYSQQDNLEVDGTPSVNCLLNHIQNSGSGWSAPHVVWNYPTNVVAYNVKGGAVVDNGTSGGVDIYFTDGDFNVANLPNGSIRKTSQTSGGVWSGLNPVIASSLHQTFGFEYPTVIRGGHANARVAWPQSTADWSVVSGSIKGYVYGDAGYLARPSIALVTPSVTSFDPAHTNSGFTLDGGNQRLTVNSAAVVNVARSLSAKSAGKFYFEMKLVTLAGPSVGLVSGSFAASGTAIGFDTGNNSIGVSGGGNVRRNNSIVKVVKNFVVTNVVGVAVDFDNSKIWFRNVITEAAWNNAAIGVENPATNTGGIAISALLNGPFYIAISDSTINSKEYINTGQFPFIGLAPAAFGLWT